MVVPEINNLKLYCRSVNSVVGALGETSVNLGESKSMALSKEE
ncbi:MAG: hypothetical protein QXI86_07660 [Ignisphaera sp.]